MDKLNLIILILLALVVSIPASAIVTHRYSFDNDANDVVAGLESTLVGNAEVADGSLVLDNTGDIDTYLELDGPAIDANSYDAISLELWFTPVAAGNGGFTMLGYLGGLGDEEGGAEDGYGYKYIFIRDASGDGNARMAISSYSLDATPFGEEDGVNRPEFDDGLEHHFIGTVDATNISFFVDGEYVGTTELSSQNTIANLSNAHARLGWGGYTVDPTWNGSIHEYRIYDKALSEREMLFTEYWGKDNPYPIVIRSMSPADGDTQSIDPSVNNDLVWNPEPLFAPDITEYYLYVGTDPNIADPNVADITALATDVYIPGTPDTSYTVVGGTLDFLKTYYWRIDTVTTAGTYQGVGSMFTTLPEEPYYATGGQPDDYILSDGDDTFTVVAGNTDTWQWYKVVGEQDSDENGETDDDMLTNAAPYSGADTASLTITGAGNTEEGYYYCEISATASPTDPLPSELGRLVIPELKSQYPMEITIYDGNTLTPDVISGYDMLLTTAVDATNIPALEPNVASGIGGTYSLKFNNIDSGDPNTWNQYALIPEEAADYEDITISGWYYWGGGAGWQRYWDIGDGTDEYMFLTPDAAGGAGLRFAMRTPTISEQLLDTTDDTSPVVDGEWFHVTVTIGGNVGRMFVNGALVDDNIGMTIDPTDFSKAVGYIGASQWPDPYYNGLIDDLRIYSYAKTPQEVAEEYTDVKTSEYVCVEFPEALAYDVNGDCRITLADITDMAALWLDCERIPAEACAW